MDLDMLRRLFTWLAEPPGHEVEYDVLLLEDPYDPTDPYYGPNGYEDAVENLDTTEEGGW